MSQPQPARARSRQADDDGPEEATPERALQRTVEEGYRRMSRGAWSMAATGVVGGFDVATGVLALLIVEHQTHSKVLAGLAFGIGFIALLLANSELFTENFLVPVAAVVARRCPLRDLVRLWLYAAVFNLAGGWVLTWIIDGGFPDLHGTAVKLGTAYATLGYGWHAFALGLLGGLVITLMTWMQHSTEAVGAKIVAAVTAAFLLGAGTLNHAIVASLVMFAALHTGHAPFGYGRWFLEFLFATLGNIVGGVGLVTLLRLLQVPHRVAEEQRAAAADS